MTEEQITEARDALLEEFHKDRSIRVKKGEVSDFDRTEWLSIKIFCDWLLANRKVTT